MTSSKVGVAVLAAAMILAHQPGAISADGPEWSDAMNAAQRAVDEARYGDAEQFLRTAVKEAENFAPGDRRLDLSYSSLATILYSRGKHAEAERTYLQAVAILEKTLGREHLRVANSLTGLAAIYQMEGKYKEVEPLLQ